MLLVVVRLLLLLLPCVVTAHSPQDLEAEVANSYVDRGQVSSHFVTLEAVGKIHYLKAGPPTGRTVLFCHGSAFTAHTWQVTGVLDALADNGFFAIAIDLPGYGYDGGKSEKLGTAAISRFLRTFADELHLLEAGRKVVVVTASMGGSFGLPLVFDGMGKYVAGYVTVAGQIPPHRSHPKVALDTPLMMIYGENDRGLKSGGPGKHEEFFRNYQLVVFPDAPHPAYLRDLEAANRFTSLVLRFVQGPGASSGTATPPELSVNALWPVLPQVDLSKVKSSASALHAPPPSSSAVSLETQPTDAVASEPPQGGRLPVAFVILVVLFACVGIGLAGIRYFRRPIDLLKLRSAKGHFPVTNMGRTTPSPLE